MLDIAKYTSAGWKPILHAQTVAKLKRPKKIDWFWVIFLTLLSFVLVGAPIVAYAMYFFMFKKPPMIRLELAKDGNIEIAGDIEIAQKTLEA